jgi:hypothetical protein
MINKDEVNDWLSSHADIDLEFVEVYPDGIDIVCGISITSNIDVIELPYKFKHVRGNFKCVYNDLINMVNFPDTVHEWVSICGNKDIIISEQYHKYILDDCIGYYKFVNDDSEDKEILYIKTDTHKLYLDYDVYLRTLRELKLNQFI